MQQDHFESKVMSKQTSPFYTPESPAEAAEMRQTQSAWRDVIAAAAASRTVDMDTLLEQGIDSSSLWLILGTVELLGQYNEAGLPGRASAHWFDSQAPKAPIVLSSRNVSVEVFNQALTEAEFWKHGLGEVGFSARICQQVPSFLTLNEEDQLECSFQALELVMRLRELNPGMLWKPGSNSYRPLLVPSHNFAVAHTRWRTWRFVPTPEQALV